MPQMNNLNNDNKNNDSEDRNHFSEYFDSIIEGLKCHATFFTFTAMRIATAAEKLAIMTQTLSEFEPSAQLPTAYLQHANARSVITCSF